MGLEKKYALSVEKSLGDEIFKWLITNFKNYNDSSDCYGYFADNAFLRDTGLFRPLNLWDREKR